MLDEGESLLRRQATRTANAWAAGDEMTTRVDTASADWAGDTPSGSTSRPEQVLESANVKGDE